MQTAQDYRPPALSGVNVKFRNGKLHIWQNAFGHKDQIFILRPWPDPRAWVRTDGSPWRGAFCPMWKLGGVFSASEYDARVPEDVQAALRQVPAQQFGLLSLLARVPAARELVRHDLALAWLLANAKLFAPACGLREIRRALAKGRRRALQLLGFPAENRLLNLLRKLDLATLQHVGELHALRHLHLDQLRELAHLPRIDGDIIALVGAPELARLRGPRLLAEMALHPARQAPPHPDRVTEKLWVILQHSLLVEREVAPLNSLAEVERAHWDARSGMHLYQQTCPPWRPAPALPPPPPQLGARRIWEEYDLIAEGAVMQHCIADPRGRYLAQLQAGRAAVFHLASPVAATVYLVHSGERWLLGEMHGVRNASVPLGQRQLVGEWIRA